MNDELFLKQLDQILPQEDSVPHFYAPADKHELPQPFHARTWSSEHTQHIVWELPAEPRFQVSRGGLRRDWKWMRPVAANLTFLALFILALVFWPHSPSRPVSLPLPAMSQPSYTRIEPTTTTALTAPYSVGTTGERSTGYDATKSRFATSSAFPTYPVRPSLYADNTVRSAASLRAIPTPSASSYRVTSYRVAPAAPIADSMPPMQSPY